MTQQIIDFKNELQQLLNSGEDLRKLSQYSYAQRESGRNVPYMAITDKEKSGKVERIYAKPTNAQKELKAFFSKQAQDSIFNEFELYVDILEGVVFKHRLGKGKTNFELL